MTEEQFNMDDEEIRDMIISFFENNSTLKDIRGLSEKDMEAIYALGYNYYNNGKCEEAKSAFQFLTFYDHLEKRWWMGLGAVNQMLKDYDGAILAYSYTAMLDVEDPTPHLHAADCFLAMEKYEEADSALAATIHWAGDKPEHAGLKERAETMQELFQKSGKGGDS